MSDASLVTAFLADRHVACPACGYDLHGARDAVCPECGARCSLGIVPRHVDARTHRVLRVAAMALIAGNATWAVYYPVNIIAYGLTFIYSLHFIFNIVAAALGCVLGVLALRTLKRADAPERRTAAVCRLLALWLIVAGVHSAIGVVVSFPWWILSWR